MKLSKQVETETRLMPSKAISSTESGGALTTYTTNLGAVLGFIIEVPAGGGRIERYSLELSEAETRLVRNLLTKTY